MNITVPIKIVINDNLCGFADPHVQDYRSMPLNRVTLKTKKKTSEEICLQNPVFENQNRRNDEQARSCYRHEILYRGEHLQQFTVVECPFAFHFLFGCIHGPLINCILHIKRLRPGKSGTYQKKIATADQKRNAK